MSIQLRVIPTISFVVASVLALTAPTAAQGLDVESGERLFGGFTEAEVEAMTPASPNPYTSYLLGAAVPDYRYWRARTALEAYRRSERRGELAPPVRLLTFAEAEPDGVTGENDAYDTAEYVAGFGTGPRSVAPELTITGSLVDADAVFEPAEPFPEDDGAIPLASDTGVGVGEGIIVQGAEIGDGPHGATTGDVDFYAVTATAPSQTIRVQMLGAMNVALYDAAGTVLASNVGFARSATFPVDYRVPEPGTYYAAVVGDAEGGEPFDVNPLPVDPFDPASGAGVGSTGAYILSISLTAHDVDVFAFDLRAGDVLGMGEGTGPLGAVEVLGPGGSLMMSSNRPISGGYPEESPLPSEGETNIGAAAVAPVTGTYAVAVRTTGSGGAYAFGVHAFRPRTETEPDETQVLFVDFDGAMIDAGEVFGDGNPSAELSPLADFVPNWGFEPEDEDELVDRIMGVLEENLQSDLLANGNNPNTGVILRNSRDHADPGNAPYVSRLIVGGTIEELGIPTTGIASSIDPGNFGLEDVGVVLLDRLSEPPGGIISLNGIEIAPGAERMDLVATTLGNIVVHEAGHFLGLYHTDMYSPVPTIQDEGGLVSLEHMTGVGPDLVFGTDDDIDADFLNDRFSLFEYFIGVEDQVNVIAFGLTESPTVAAEEDRSDAAAVMPFYPNPLSVGGVATLEIRSVREEHVQVQIYDVAGRLVRTEFEGRVAPGHHKRVRIAARDLAAGVYLVRVQGERESAVRRLTVVR